MAIFDDLASPLSVIMMGVETFKAFVPNIEKLTEKLTSRDVTTDLEEIIDETKSQLTDINYFLNGVTTAVEDVNQR